MAIKIDKDLLPIKAHFFFFFAALGPVLPQLNVFGRQLGISPQAMGAVTAVLPLLWAAAKPLFGYLVDYFTTLRKMIFMMLIALMTGSYCGLWFIPAPPPQPPGINEQVYHMNHTVHLEKLSPEMLLEKFDCHWNCSDERIFELWLPNATHDGLETVYLRSVTDGSCERLSMKNDSEGGRVSCISMANCTLLCLKEGLLSPVEDNASDGGQAVQAPSLYTSGVFWWYVVLMCVGTVAFNVANCIGDAVCFDVLGAARAPRYGPQRLFGTLGYGLTALLGGWLVDRGSSASGPKDFTPAFALAAAFTCLDLVSCRALKLPALPPPAGSAELRAVLRLPRVRLFVVFAIVAGAMDSFIIYYMFWFLEELAEDCGRLAQVKLIEGAVVAGQSFVGEMLCFALSGKIIGRFGFGATMSMSLLCYAVRLALVSVVTDPWQLVVIESIMQGPTYALCYACIVGYAASCAPPGYAATVQGVVAGMDDGVGFAVGSLVGGQLFARAGARGSFRAMAAAAAAAAAAHALGRRWLGDDEKPSPPAVMAGEEQKMLPIEDNGNTIYKPTVEPLGRGDQV